MTVSKIEPTTQPQPTGGATQPSPATGRSGVGFENVLAGAKRISMPRASVTRWHSLNFLNTQAMPKISWPWLQDFDRTLDRSLMVNSAATPSVSTISPTTSLSNTQPMTLADYPRPPADTGKGIHWIPTVSQTPEVVDKFVQEAVKMGMKWVVFLNEGAEIGDNDYLVDKLTQAGIEPIMRVYTPGVTAIEGDLKAMVQHYKQMGVTYFQLYNEPNLMVETGGQYPSVDKYLDLWVPAAQKVIEAGGLPGFGALSPQGEMDDRQFLEQSLTSLINRGKDYLLNRSWLAMHNYTGPRPLNDPDGFMRFKQYNNIVQQVLGRPLPIIGTEGGTHISEHVTPNQQIDMVTNAYNYMQTQREPYNFAYTYWIIANGHDSAWDEHALFRPDGPTDLAKALQKIASGART